MNATQKITIQQLAEETSRKFVMDKRRRGREYPEACGLIETIHASTTRASFEIKAWVDDDSGLETRLLTGPDFGCVRHEVKA